VGENRCSRPPILVLRTKFSVRKVWSCCGRNLPYRGQWERQRSTAEPAKQLGLPPLSGFSRPGPYTRLIGGDVERLHDLPKVVGFNHDSERIA
jgi:hypothetical protein